MADEIKPDEKCQTCSHNGTPYGEESCMGCENGENHSAESPKPEEPVRGQWSYKEEFGIVREMKKVVNLTKSATEMELEGLRRKLDRLTYGG